MNEAIIMTLYSKGIYLRNISFLEVIFNHIIDEKVKVNKRLFTEIETDLKQIKTTIVQIVSKKNYFNPQMVF
jgi:hypothetical protein